MRILHVVGESKFGGGSVMIHALAGKAQAQGWTVHVLTTDDTFADMLKESGVGVVRLEAVWREIRPWRDVLGLWRLYRFLKLHRYTVVHTHTSKGGFIGRLAARLAGIPVIVHTAHGFAFNEA
jgi:UDP-N-acetylglucosamine:LPS N-acetylglucosamine transferase